MNAIPFIPTELQEVLGPIGELPIEYIPIDELIRVQTDPRMNEWTFATGAQIHRNWESARINRFGPTSVFPADAVKVLCPTGEFLAIKFYDPSVPSPKKQKPRGLKLNKV